MPDDLRIDSKHSVFSLHLVKYCESEYLVASSDKIYIFDVDGLPTEPGTTGLGWTRVSRRRLTPEKNQSAIRAAKSLRLKKQHFINFRATADYLFTFTKKYIGWGFDVICRSGAF